MKTERNKRSTRYGMVQLGEAGEEHYKIVSGQKLSEMQKDERMEKITVASVSNEGGE